LALGVCLGLLLELRDKSLRNEGDVIAALELPVLSQVPWVGVETAGQNANGKRRLGFMSSPGNRAGNVEV
jgi:hypothetical protein